MNDWTDGWGPFSQILNYESLNYELFSRLFSTERVWDAREQKDQKRLEQLLLSPAAKVRLRGQFSCLECGKLRPDVCPVRL